MIPRTLDALRSAVARVLVARGEAPDALRVTLAPSLGARWAVSIWTGAAVSPLESGAYGDDESDACSRAWGAFVLRLAAEDAAASDAMWRAITERRRAKDALTAARAVEAGE